MLNRKYSKSRAVVIGFLLLGLASCLPALAAPKDKPFKMSPPLQFNFVDQPLNPNTDVFDTYGHGTHVIGMIAGDGYDSLGQFRGIAPYSDILSLRVLDDQGRGKVSDAIDALDWLLVHGPQYNIRVGNLSIGKALEEPAAGPVSTGATSSSPRTPRKVRRCTIIS
jgi:subtilisin family serine protease